VNPNNLVIGKQYLFLPYNEVLIYDNIKIIEQNTRKVSLYVFKNKGGFHNLSENNVCKLIIPYTKLYSALDLLNAP
jgi:hypothetical protein